jgi:hypothetical protein
MMLSKIEQVHMHNELALINHQHENQRLHQVDLVEGFKQRNILLPIAEARVMEHLIGHSMMQVSVNIVVRYFKIIRIYMVLMSFTAFIIVIFKIGIT